jgi:diadenosine tetraphosphate (Ap4A) HIT family hydrolase
MKTSHSEGKGGCPFCEIPSARRISENELAYVVRDARPVTPMHSLVIPKRHVSSYFDLSQSEIDAIHRLLFEQKESLEESDTSIDGFNVGVNCGEAAGQTVFHCHIHLIPRRTGDVPVEHRGGVRHVIPHKSHPSFP